MPVAFLVVQKETVKLLPISHSSAIDKLLDYVPDLMEKINGMFNQQIEQKKEKNKGVEHKTKYEFKYDETPIEYETEENFEEKE